MKPEMLPAPAIEAPTIEAPAADATAEAVRRALRDADVFCVALAGGPGCGKSTLLGKTAERLAPDVRVVVITADAPRRRPGDGCAGGAGAAGRAARLVRVDLDGRQSLGPRHVRDALAHLDLAGVDLLFIENVGALPPARERADLGQDACVTVFSAAAGDDKARKHADLVATSDAVLLNKTDLLLSIPFDLASFRQDVRRIGSEVPLFELSALSGHGMVPWLDWLRRRVRKSRRVGDDVSHWFG